jgi:hypothetical protein
MKQDYCNGNLIIGYRAGGIEMAKPAPQKAGNFTQAYLWNLGGFLVDVLKAL